MKILFIILVILAAVSLSFPVWKMNSEIGKEWRKYHEREKKNAKRP